jgi:hypothetical protein
LSTKNPRSTVKYSPCVLNTKVHRQNKEWANGGR